MVELEGFLGLRLGLELKLVVVIRCHKAEAEVAEMMISPALVAILCAG